MMHALLSLAYLAIAVGMTAFENRRRLRAGFDAFHLVLFFYALYVLMASVIIHGVLAIDPAAVTGVPFFDAVYAQLRPEQAVAVLLLNIIFLAGFYSIRLRFSAPALGTASVLATSRAKYRVSLRPMVLSLWLLFGALICGFFFWQLGDSFVERYASLILFRNLDEAPDRNAFTANAFSATMSFSWLCAALVYYFRQQDRKISFAILIALTFFFSLLMGSRRGFIFPIIIIYLCFASASNRTFLRRLAYLAPVALLWITFGKQFTGALAYDGDTNELVNIYSSVDSGILRAFSDVGIGQVQSFAVLQHFDFAPRFGTDHMLSVLRRIPGKEFIGIPADYFPERITRITTTLFSSAEDADIPPGLIGASWLDFPVLGAFVWGLALALQAGLLEYFRVRIQPSRAKIALTVLLAVIVAMPINTGSYDFTVSVDIVLLFLVLATTVRLQRVSISGRETAIPCAE